MQAGERVANAITRLRKECSSLLNPKQQRVGLCRTNSNAEWGDNLIPTQNSPCWWTEPVNPGNRSFSRMHARAIIPRPPAALSPFPQRPNTARTSCLGCCCGSATALSARACGRELPQPCMAHTMHGQPCQLCKVALDILACTCTA